tara:strand:+ start:112 stop:360 length:249 start_codon:yes stop_codon:yes gene_type:complete
MLGELLPYNPKTHTDNFIFYVEIIIQVKKLKKSKAKLDVFAMMVQELEEKTPVKQNSGKGVVKDTTIARLQDIYKKDQKDDV